MKIAEEWHEPDTEPEKPSTFVPLTVRKPSEILAMEFSDEDFLLAGGYLSKGDPIAICGAAGVGKSRLSMQLIIALVTGRLFLGWQTNGKGTRWLILQTENSNRRLKYELSNMMSDLTKAERQAG
jgi:RecA-family ATPase